jgi:hypothetical protein
MLFSASFRNIAIFAAQARNGRLIDCIRSYLPILSNGMLSLNLTQSGRSEICMAARIAQELSHFPAWSRLNKSIESSTLLLIETVS